MQVKTSELTGAALDWAVAKCENYQWRCPWILEKEGYKAWMSYEQSWGNPTPDYSTNWEHGGIIVEREDFTLVTRSKEEESQLANPNPNFKVKAELWVANKYHCAFGPTKLIAAMRCYVASKLGDIVEIPDGLK